jgi:hypothetical protein
MVLALVCGGVLIAMGVLAYVWTKRSYCEDETDGGDE